MKRLSALGLWGARGKCAPEPRAQSPEPRAESPLATQLPVPDAMRLIGVRAEAALLVLFVFAEVAVEPIHTTLPFERQDVRRDAIEEPAIVADDDRAAGEIFQR